MAIYLSGSERATVEFAKKYSASLSAGDVVLLQGDLGAGKTVFCKGLALGLGIKDEIVSPTYAYVTAFQAARKRKSSVLPTISAAKACAL